MSRETSFSNAGIPAVPLKTGWKPGLALAILAAVAALAGAPAEAQSLNWIGPTGDTGPGNWNTTEANWLGPVAWGPNDGTVTAVFTNNTPGNYNTDTITLTEPISLAGIQFQPAGRDNYQLQGNTTLTIGSGGITDDHIDANAPIVSVSQILLAADQQWSGTLHSYSGFELKNTTIQPSDSTDRTLTLNCRWMAMNRATRTPSPCRPAPPGRIRTSATGPR